MEADRLPLFNMILSERPNFHHFHGILRAEVLIPRWAMLDDDRRHMPCIDLIRLEFVLRSLVNVRRKPVAGVVNDAIRDLDLRVSPRDLSTDSLYAYMQHLGMSTQQTFVLPPPDFFSVSVMTTSMLGAYAALLPILKDVPCNACTPEGAWSWPQFIAVLRSAGLSFRSLVAVACNVLKAMNTAQRIAQYARVCVFDVFIDPRAPQVKLERPCGLSIEYIEDQRLLSVYATGAKTMTACCTKIAVFGQLRRHIYEFISNFDEAGDPVTLDRDLFRPCMETPIDPEHHVLCAEGAVYQVADWPTFADDEYVTEFVRRMTRALLLILNG
jgi:hypothetical protein